MKNLFFLSTTFIGMAGIAQAQTNSALQVKGDVTKSGSYTVATLQKVAPVQSIVTTMKGKPYTAKGVSLWSLIDASKPKYDPKVKHSEVRFVVLARGKDGYAASFSLPELMPEVGAKKVFVVWEANGKPLSAKEGPLRLVVPDDKKPMRWVFNLTSVEIYDGKRLSSQKQ